MSMTISTTKLHLNKREATFGVPLYITAVVAVISVLISFLFWRSGSVPGTPAWVQGSQSNPGIAYALAGFSDTWASNQLRRRFHSPSLSGPPGADSLAAPFSGVWLPPPI